MMTSPDTSAEGMAKRQGCYRDGFLEGQREAWEVALGGKTRIYTSNHHWQDSVHVSFEELIKLAEEGEFLTEFDWSDQIVEEIRRLRDGKH